MKKFKEFLREEQEKPENFYAMSFEDAEAHANVSFAADPSGIFKQDNLDILRTRLNWDHPAIKFLFHRGHTEQSLDAASDHLLKLAKRELTGEEVLPYEAHPTLIYSISRMKNNIQSSNNIITSTKENTNEEYDVYLDMPKKKKKRTKKKAKRYTFPYYGFNFYGHEHNTEGESGGGDGGGGE